MKHCCFYTAPCGKKECLHVIILFVFAGIEVCKGSDCKRRSFRLYQDQIPLVAWSESKANPEQKQQIEENWRQTALGSHPFSWRARERQELWIWLCSLATVPRCEKFQTQPGFRCVTKAKWHKDSTALLLNRGSTEAFSPLNLNPHSFNATARAGNKCSS